MFIFSKFTFLLVMTGWLLVVDGREGTVSSIHNLTSKLIFEEDIDIIM